MISVSKKSDSKFKHCSAIIVGKKIIMSYNKLLYKNKEPYSSIHAEVSAIKSYLRYGKEKDLHKSTIIVIRSNSHFICNSCPCDNCKRIIKKYGIEKIIYSTGHSDKLSDTLFAFSYL